MQAGAWIEASSIDHRFVAGHSIEFCRQETAARTNQLSQSSKLALILIDPVLAYSTFMQPVLTSKRIVLIVTSFSARPQISVNTLKTRRAETPEQHFICQSGVLWHR